MSAGTAPHRLLLGQAASSNGHASSESERFSSDKEISCSVLGTMSRHSLCAAFKGENSYCTTTVPVIFGWMAR
jgi:hypothetical protein